MAGEHPVVAGQLGQPFQTLEDLRQAAGLQIGAAAALLKQGVAAEHGIAAQEGAAAGGS